MQQLIYNSLETINLKTDVSLDYSILTGTSTLMLFVRPIVSLHQEERIVCSQLSFSPVITHSLKMKLVIINICFSWFFIKKCFVKKILILLNLQQKDPDKMDKNCSLSTVGAHFIFNQTQYLFS